MPIAPLLIALLNGATSVFKLFNKASVPDSGLIAAHHAEDISQQLKEEIHNADSQEANNLKQLHDTDSLHDQRDSVAAAIARANQDASSDHPMPPK